MPETTPNAERWHLSKEVPISLFLGMVVQAVAVIWFISALHSRVDANEQATQQNAAEIAQNEDDIQRLPERLARIETILELMLDRMDREQEQEP
jgi:hypothetical protein